VAPAGPVLNPPTAGATPPIDKPLTTSRTGILVVMLCLRGTGEEEKDGEEKTGLHGCLPSLLHIIQKRGLIENP